MISDAVWERISLGLAKFQPVLQRALATERNERDTVMIITDIFAEVFGYDKYENITSEFLIKRQFCDLAIKIDGEVKLLVECKSVFTKLREEHVLQAVGYACNSGIEWVVLTNGIHWMIYRVVFSKPVEHIMVYDFNFCELDANKPDHISLLCGLCRESFSADGNEVLDTMFSRRGTINRYIVGQVLLNDWMVTTIRRSVQRHFPSVQLTDSKLREMLRDEILRVEITQGKDAEEASQIVAAANSRMRARQKQKKK